MWYLIAAAILVLVILPPLFLSYLIFAGVLVRTKKTKWARGISMEEDRQLAQMYEEGCAWEEKNRARKTAVTVKSGSLTLAGEYFDFGAKRAVIVIPGRMETCVYSYFFASPYEKCGFNVLVIDNRAHGESDGRLNCLGYREEKDVLAWAAFLHDKKGNESVLLHGVCVGSSTALFALVDPACPAYVDRMVADGIYASFYETFRTHMIEQHHPTFPFVPCVMLYVRLFCGGDPKHDGPLARISRLEKPILFLHSEEDVFSLPARTRTIYEKCTAPKRIVWFEKGAHSRLRVTDPEKYDRAVAEFLTDPPEKKAEEK